MLTSLHQGSPAIEGRVDVFTEQSDTAATCAAALFTPLDQYDKASYIRQRLTCGPAENPLPEIIWQFRANTDEGDLYDFTINSPLSQNSISSTTVKITYDGTEQLVFENPSYKVMIAPPEEQQQSPE